MVQLWLFAGIVTLLLNSDSTVFLYVRLEFQNKVEVHLISSETKVALIKTLSISRPELCGGFIVSRTDRSTQFPEARYP